jgi:hypothetical protein
VPSKSVKEVRLYACQDCGAVVVLTPPPVRGDMKVVFTECTGTCTHPEPNFRDGPPARMIPSVTPHVPVCIDFEHRMFMVPADA